MIKTTLSATTFLVLFLIPISAQKIVLHLDATPSAPPSVSKAALRYNKDFAYSFTLDDCSVDHYTIAKPFFLGGVVPNSGYTSPGFFYTDGCGNDVPFKAGIAWNSTTVGNYGPNENDPNKMSWAQLQELYNYGWDVLSHSYAHRAWGEISSSNTYVSEVTQNIDNIRRRMGIEVPCFVVPSGDYNFQDVALQQGHKAVFDQNFPQGGVSFNGIVVDGDVNLTNLKAFRDDITFQIDNPVKLTNIANQCTGDTHIWYNEFAHHLDIFNNSPFNFFKFKDYMIRIANTYGKNGSDRMWFAPLQEVYEYVISRQSVSYSVNLTSDKKYEITLNLSAVPRWLRRKTVTFVINTTVNFSNITLPEGITATWRGTGNTKLLNLDFTNFAPTIPVELVSFSAQAKGTTALLNWETAYERRFQGFEIERSFDGTNYVPIGKVKALGNASKYAFEDNYFEKTSYYRLKMLDNDKTFDYSRITTLFVESKYTVKITPSVSDNTVLIETDFNDKTDTTIGVYDQSGKTMLQRKATNLETISLDNFPPGLYFVRVNHGQDFWVKKVVNW